MSKESFPEQNPDFDDFLSQLDDHQLQSAESAARIELITHRISEALERYGIETVLNADLEVDHEKERELLQELTHEFHDAFAQNDQYLDSDEITRYAEQYLATLKADQMTLLAKIKMSIVAFDEEGVDHEEKTAHKSKIIAEWMIEHNYGIDSNWVRFLNDLLPGDDLTTENADEYLHKAVIKEAAAADRREKLITAAEAAMRSTGKDLVIEQVSELLMIAMTRHESYEMEARIDEAARKAGLTTTEGRKFVETLRSELDTDQQSE